MNNTIGTCSLCGGRVEIPNMMVNPIARCVNCGAHPKHAYGPIIRMVNPNKRDRTSDELYEAWKVISGKNS